MTEQILIENIDKTYNGTQYAYESEGEFNVEFIAECIEHGEQFHSSFFATQKHTKEQLKDIGQDLAMGWGGECISVNRVVQHNNNGTVTMVRVA